MTNAVHSSMSDVFRTTLNEEMSLTHQRRLAAYRKYWLHYLGAHWSYQRDEGETQLTYNYCRRLVDLHANFTFKNGFKCSIPDDPTTEEIEPDEREFVRHMLEETWRKNNMKMWAISAGQMGGITGDVFCRVSWDDTEPLETPYARVDIIPSHFCFPDFGGHSGWDIRKLRRMLIMIPVYRENKVDRLSNRGWSLANKSEATHQVTFLMEEWTNPIKGPDGVVTPAMFRLYEGEKLLKEEENPLGVIPVVHIANYPLAGEYYGISDLADITGLNRELNEKATDISDIINYHGSPITIVKGAKLKDMEKGMNRVWGVPENADVRNLELVGDLAAANQFYATLKSTILEITGTPPQALGIIQAVSNTSGVALQLQYLPILEKRDVKVQAYGTGIQLINRLIIRVTELADARFGAKLNKLEGDKYRNEVIFPDPMPQDERRELENTRARLEMGISNRHRELEAQGYSQSQITQILDGAIEELRREAQMALEYGESEFSTSPGPGNKIGRRGGSPLTHGEKVNDSLLADAGAYHEEPEEAAKSVKSAQPEKD